MAKGLVPLICPNCGGSIPLDARHEDSRCPFCSSSLSLPDLEKPGFEAIEGRLDSVEKKITEPPPGKKKPARGVWIFLGFVALGMLFTGCLWWLFQPAKTGIARPKPKRNLEIGFYEGGGGLYQYHDSPIHLPRGQRKTLDAILPGSVKKWDFTGDPGPHHAEKGEMPSPFSPDGVGIGLVLSATTLDPGKLAAERSIAFLPGILPRLTFFLPSVRIKLEGEGEFFGEALMTFRFLHGVEPLGTRVVGVKKGLAGYARRREKDFSPLREPTYEGPMGFFLDFLPRAPDRVECRLELKVEGGVGRAELLLDDIGYLKVPPTDPWVSRPKPEKEPEPAPLPDWGLDLRGKIASGFFPLDPGRVGLLSSWQKEVKGSATFRVLEVPGGMEELSGVGSLHLTLGMTPIVSSYSKILNQEIREAKPTVARIHRAFYFRGLEGSLATFTADFRMTEVAGAYVRVSLLFQKGHRLIQSGLYGFMGVDLYGFRPRVNGILPPPPNRGWARKSFKVIFPPHRAPDNVQVWVELESNPWATQDVWFSNPTLQLGPDTRPRKGQKK